MSEHWEDRLHRERDEARELADFRGEQVVRLSEECAQLRARVAELEAHLPRMDGPSRVEYLERRVAELEETEAFLDGQMQELDGLRAKLAEQEWLPIETAPRDGTWILTWNLLLERPITVRGYGISLGNDTHWMPLPPGPGPSPDQEAALAELVEQAQELGMGYEPGHAQEVNAKPRDPILHRPFLYCAKCEKLVRDCACPLSPPAQDGGAE